MPSSSVVGAFVFPEFWNDPERAKSGIASLRESGVTAIMTESDSYEHFVVDLAHQAGLRFYAGVACFSDHASNFRWIKEHEARDRRAAPAVGMVYRDAADRP